MNLWLVEDEFFGNKSFPAVFFSSLVSDTWMPHARVSNFHRRAQLCTYLSCSWYISRCIVNHSFQKQFFTVDINAASDPSVTILQILSHRSPVTQITVLLWLSTLSDTWACLTNHHVINICTLDHMTQLLIQSYWMSVLLQYSNLVF